MRVCAGADEGPRAIRAVGITRSRCPQPARAHAGSPRTQEAGGYAELAARGAVNLYRRLLALRRGSVALRTGSYLPVDQVPPECFVFERSQGTERVLVAVNFSAEPLFIEAAGFTGRIAVSTERVNEGNGVEGALHLLPYEAVVVM